MLKIETKVVLKRSKTFGEPKDLKEHHESVKKDIKNKTLLEVLEHKGNVRTSFFVSNVIYHDFLLKPKMESYFHINRYNSSASNSYQNLFS